MAIYQFILTPVDQFFFGGEKHDTKGETINYFVESNPYPQQTTILGLVRYYLLLKHNLIGTDKIKAEGEDLIGLSSFDFDTKKQLFGKIESISPLYFVNQGNNYFPAPFDVEHEIDKEYGYYFMHKSGKKFISKDYFPPMKVIDSAGQIGPLLLGSSATECIVYPTQHTGNEKGERGESKEDAFYKQAYMKMKPGWGFAFDANITEEVTEEELYINFGGEKSLFSLKVCKIEKSSSPCTRLPLDRNNLYGFYCLSDCFSEPQLLENTCFAVTKAVSFRNFQSSIKTKNYAVYNPKDPDGMIRGNRFNLLARGSVLYFKTKAKRDEASEFLDKPNCTNIGFNNYLKIN